MKKSILNLGKTLNKEEQKKISGGDKYDDPVFVENGCSDGSIPTYTCINGFIVGYCDNGSVIGGDGRHCI